MHSIGLHRSRHWVRVQFQYCAEFMSTRQSCSIYLEMIRKQIAALAVRCARLERYLDDRNREGER